ncbi:MAG: hypothetical protein LBE27_04295 [Deltaproteobacteria bacterium]|jgi:hypothetical protein|nr:hypothetical protein [Deltaproteobacteria bacterium]
MGMIIIFCLALVALALGLWRALGALALNNPVFSLGLVDSFGLAMILGGLYWGVVANPDTVILEPLLAINLFCGALVFILFFFIMPDNIGEAKLTGWKLFLIPLLLFPGFFFWASSPPFLCALCFPEEKGTGRGLFTVVALVFFSLAAGLFGSGIWERHSPLSHRYIGDISIFLSVALGLWLWMRRPPRDTEEMPLRFFPVKSLGYWTGDKIYGQELLVYSRVKRTLTPSSFIGSVAAGGLVQLSLGTKLPWKETYACEPVILVLVTLGLGALLWGPLIASFTPPMTTLALNSLVLSFFLLGPLKPDGNLSYELTLSLAPLLCAGALVPLYLRVGVSRHDFLPYSLGKMDIFLVSGFFLGGSLSFLYTAKPIFHLATTTILGILALASAALAAGPSLSWTVPLILTAGIGLLYYTL